MAHGSQPYQRRTGEADGTVRIQGGREILKIKKHLFVQQSIDIDIRRKYHKFMKQEEQMR